MKHTTNGATRHGTAENPLVSPRQREWIRTVLRDALGWPDDMLAEHNAIPQTLAVTIQQHQETLRPDLVLMDGGSPRLLIQLLPPGQDPDRRPPDTTWNASCVSRMAELLISTQRAAGPGHQR